MNKISILLLICIISCTSDIKMGKDVTFQFNVNFGLQVNTILPNDYYKWDFPAYNDIAKRYRSKDTSKYIIYSVDTFVEETPIDSTYMKRRLAKLKEGWVGESGKIKLYISGNKQCLITEIKSRGEGYYVDYATRYKGTMLSILMYCADNSKLEETKELLNNIMQNTDIKGLTDI